MTSTKTFIITTNYTITPFVFSSIFVNYTLIDALLYNNGIYAKFYSNNNFKGQPLLTTILPQSYIAASDSTTYWYRMFQENRDFSVKLSALIMPNITSNYSFMTGFTSNF